VATLQFEFLLIGAQKTATMTPGIEVNIFPAAANEDDDDDDDDDAAMEL